MKGLFKQIFALICALYFLVAGSGYNIIRYCCDGCAEEGIEAVATNSCETIHHTQEHDDEACCKHDAVEHEDIACSDVNHQADGCHMWRLQTDIPFAHVVAAFEYSDFGVDFELPYAVLNLLDRSAFDQEILFISSPPDVPLDSGRDILTYHAVLLI